ncbi:hypothetical protein LDO26_06635 [Luteimonas sp. BDR2-5]|uniref:hypothetical protein n=1 Tax=Proluteimonas luteida TaxID=2878685 RepID=UPI001E580CA2|nr:hypothetical protein [Luteimonas sp. BDR2-5]MCD9027880.1 hypothetical protein [Luteimonas sp. BDR2-5]
MSDWERDANAALHALGEAWQQGGISRETYRERRRRIIAALRDRGDETERRAVSPPAVAGETGAAAEGATMMLGLRRGSPSSLRWLAVLAAASAAVATAVWMVWTMEQGNV